MDVFKFRECMNANSNDENKCLDSKKVLDKCSFAAFNEVNTDPKWVF